MILTTKVLPSSGWNTLNQGRFISLLMPLKRINTPQPKCHKNSVVTAQIVFASHAKEDDVNWHTTRRGYRHDDVEIQTVVKVPQWRFFQLHTTPPCYANRRWKNSLRLSRSIHGMCCSHVVIPHSPLPTMYTNPFCQWIHGSNRGNRINRRDFRTDVTSQSSPPQLCVELKIDSVTGIAHVILNRPEKLNAMDVPMMEAIQQTVQEIQATSTIRVVVIYGKGRAFCTGLDIPSVFQEYMGNSSKILFGQNRKQPIGEDGIDHNDLISRLLDRPIDLNSTSDDTTSQHSKRKITNLVQDVSLSWRELPIPVIAAVHGMCFGAGLQLALGADMRITTPTCKWSIMESKWGLIPDMGITVTLPELVRMDVAKELTMTGKIILGHEAAVVGLATRCVESNSTTEVSDESTNKKPDLSEQDVVLQHALALAQDLVQQSPDAIAATKTLFQQTWRSANHAASLQLESDLQRKLLASWNQITAAARRKLGWNIPYRQRKDIDVHSGISDEPKSG